MFTILCEHCENALLVKQYPGNAQVPCPRCHAIQSLASENQYYPFLTMIQGLEKGKEFKIVGITTLGRGSYNTIHVEERKASRKHAEIKYQNGCYYLEDLKSGNGTYVNNQPVTLVELQDKDRIRIGEAIFMFRNPYQYSTVEDGDETLVSRHVSTQDAVLVEKESVFQRTNAELKFDAQHSFLMSAEQLQDITELEKANTKLRILYEVNHAISSILDLSELLGVILDVVFQYIPAERGAIFLYDMAMGTLKSAVTKRRSQESQESITISKTILERVVKEKVSLLTTDAMVDERLAESMSIISQGIRSAMSVPLISKKNLLGVLHIDSTQKSTHFNPDTLELLTGIAAQAAIALENANLLREIEREIETRGHLQRYLSPELVEQIVTKKMDLEIGGQLKKATILFSDLRGFTKMTENIGAEAVVAVLNDYFARMVDIIFDTQGTLDKFIGDAIMAIWGIPISHEEDTIHAVKASLQMQQELFYFNLFQRKMKRNILKMGVGINVGDVVVGNMGSPKRMEYTVIGPPVNLASRVETLTGRNQILISDNVYNEIADSVHVVPLAPTQVKGIVRLIQIYGVVGIYDPKTKSEITFLPLFIANPQDSNLPYEGLIETMDFPTVLFAMEPNPMMKPGEKGSFTLDIPEIAPTQAVSFVCKKCVAAFHGQDEFFRVEAEVLDMPESVKDFFAQVFPIEDLSTTVYDG